MASNTGIYRYNPETKEMEKISDSIPSVARGPFWNNDWDHSGFYSEALGVHCKSKEHKQKVMDKLNVQECG